MNHKRPQYTKNKFQKRFPSGLMGNIYPASFATYYENLTAHLFRGQRIISHQFSLESWSVFSPSALLSTQEIILACRSKGPATFSCPYVAWRAVSGSTSNHANLHNDEALQGLFSLKRQQRKHTRRPLNKHDWMNNTSCTKLKDMSRNEEKSGSVHGLELDGPNLSHRGSLLAKLNRISWGYG